MSCDSQCFSLIVLLVLRINILFIIIGGSHMVPMDVPEQCYDMMSRFINDKSFFDAKQPYPRVKNGKYAGGSEKSSQPIIENTSNQTVMAVMFLSLMLIVLGFSYYYRNRKNASNNKYVNVSQLPMQNIYKTEKSVGSGKNENVYQSI